MLPVNVDYSWSDVPIHMATNFIPDNTRTIFDEYFGGVTMFPTISFDEINGYSNEYWGWGFEDDDLLYRCKLHQIPLNTLAIPQPGGQTAALKFNGVNSYVEGVFDFNRYDEITIFVSFCPETMVLNTESYDDKFTIFANSNLRLTYNSYSRYTFEIFDDNGDIIYIDSNIVTNYKTNICATIDNVNKKIKVYQDGQIIGNSTFERLHNYTKEKDFYLGCVNPERARSVGRGASPHAVKVLCAWAISRR
jgi:hypothetical protein